MSHGDTVSATDQGVQLSEKRVLLLAVTAAIVTANAYYIHPIIARVAESFEVRHAIVGAVPAFNQVALAVGIFFLLPLGDRISNRRLITVSLLAQVVALVVMALAENFLLFIAASTALGFFTITPYLLPAYASRRVELSRLGHVTAVLTAGVIGGIVLSRTASGVVGEYLGWRYMYWIAAGLMLGSTLALRALLEEDAPRGGTTGIASYWQLISSLPPLLRQYPDVVASGVIQGLSFGIFLLIWMGIGLHLTSPEVGLGVDDVGYLGVFSVVNVVTTPLLGRWADRVGPKHARVWVAAVQMAGLVLLLFCGDNFWLLAVPIVIISIAGPVVDVTGRMTALGAAPDFRTRLMSLYIVLMFLGGGMGSWAGTITYDLGGWTFNVSIALCFSALVIVLSVAALRRDRH